MNNNKKACHVHLTQDDLKLIHSQIKFDNEVNKDVFYGSDDYKETADKLDALVVKLEELINNK